MARVHVRRLGRYADVSFFYDLPIRSDARCRYRIFVMRGSDEGARNLHQSFFKIIFKKKNICRFP